MYEFTGKIIKVTPIVDVTGKFKEKCTFIVEDGTKKIAFVLFDDSIYTILKPLEIGDQVKVTFNVKSLEFSGSWVTNCYPIKVEKITNNSNSNNNSSNNNSNNWRSKANAKNASLKNPYFPLFTSKEAGKRIHRELCKKHHPDVPGGSHEKMQEINKYYDMFSKLHK